MKRLLLTASVLLALALPATAWAVLSASQLRLAANFDASKVEAGCSMDASYRYAGDLKVRCRWLSSSAVVRYDFQLPRSQTGTVYVKVSSDSPVVSTVQKLDSHRYQVKLSVVGPRTVDIRAVSLSYYTKGD